MISNAQLRLGSTTLCVTLLVGAMPPLAAHADSAAPGWAVMKESLVKIWVLDKSGTPVDTGSGVVIQSDASGSTIATAEHVVHGAAKIIVDYSRDLHDMPGTVIATGDIDLALVHVDHVMHPALLRRSSHKTSEGDTVAAAGYVKHDVLIGVESQTPQLRYPGTISAIPENGSILQLGTTAIEAGMSGGPLFDPTSGALIGIVDTQTGETGGYAVALGSLNALLDKQHVLARMEPEPTAERPAVAAAPVVVATPAAAQVAVADAGTPEFTVLSTWTTNYSDAKLVHVRINFHPMSALAVRPSDFRITTTSSTGGTESVRGLNQTAPTYQQSKYDFATKTTQTRTVASINPREDLGASGGIRLEAGDAVTKVVTFPVRLDADVSHVGDSLRLTTADRVIPAAPVASAPVAPQVALRDTAPQAGAGSVTAASYVPYANTTWNFTCKAVTGSQFSASVTMTPFMPLVPNMSGFRVVYRLAGNVVQDTIEGVDTSGNAYILGFNVAGSTRMLPTPALTVPSHASPGWQADIPESNGGTSRRTLLDVRTFNTANGTLEGARFRNVDGSAANENTFIRGLGLAEFSTGESADAPRCVRDFGTTLSSSSVPPSGSGYLGAKLSWDQGRLLVTEVLVCSPAGAAGLHTGDVIVVLAGTRPTGLEQSIGIIRATTPGTSMHLEVLRNGTIIQGDITVGRAP